ncbi:hypothetical protein P691DRAFT_568995 [Macrolepiota fuliginosa MF-IS2]|uniref:Uncharacterized protein n=1 Tax=Macrolepiota fuliginosa MF-IS2 TaxID=1400762 RepID=A0A9P5XFG5_9AGAR|nr:hypothetical protein P691DRAFT_568995 [Macrolepiota fuliginosa MF-IS2]
MAYDPESGFSRRKEFHRRYTQGYHSNDPFNPSIAQNVQNNRMGSRFENMDDIPLPSRPTAPTSQPFPPVQQSYYPYAPVSQPIRPTQPPIVPPPLRSYQIRPTQPPVIIQPTMSQPPMMAQPGSYPADYTSQPGFMSFIPPIRPISSPSARSRRSRRYSRSYSRSPSRVRAHRRMRRSRSPSYRSRSPPSHRQTSRRRSRSRSRSPIHSRRGSPHPAYRYRSRSPVRHYYSERRSPVHSRSRSHSHRRSRSHSRDRRSHSRDRRSHSRDRRSHSRDRRSHSRSSGPIPISAAAPPSHPGPSLEPRTPSPAHSLSRPHVVPVEGEGDNSNEKISHASSVRSSYKSSSWISAPELPSLLDSEATQSITASSRHTPTPYSIPSGWHRTPAGPPSLHASTRSNSQKFEEQGHNYSEYPQALDRTSTLEHFPFEPAQQESVKLHQYVKTFVMETLPRQIYLHFLLRLPSLYFSRVNRIFQEADLTMEEIKEMALQASAEDNKTFQQNMLNMGYYYHPETSNLSPAYQRLKTGWEQFIDNLMREWKTLNIISVLLLSAIMTMFQIQSASDDPVTRYVAFWSLTCALLSILYGCLFIIRFSTMRKASKAAEWALEARKSQTIFWNVWVMLSMPVVWLAWSILTFIVCIMSFMWRARVGLPADYTFPAPPSTEFGFRIFICAVLATGVIYGALILNTFRRYGAPMDEAWKRRVESFIAITGPMPTYPQTLPPSWYNAPPVTVPRPKSSPRGSSSDYTPYIGALGARGFGDTPVVIPHAAHSVPPPPPRSPPVYVPRTPILYQERYHRSRSQSRRREYTRSRSRTPIRERWNISHTRIPSRSPQKYNISHSRSRSRSRSPRRRNGSPNRSRSRAGPAHTADQGAINCPL